MSNTDPDLWVVGLDLGQTTDPSALVLMGRTGTPPAEYATRHLKRWNLGTPYQTIAADVATLMTSPKLGDIERALVADQTGVGRPVVEMLYREGLEPVSVTITSGLEVTKVNRQRFAVIPDRRALSIPIPVDVDPRWDYRVPKRVLVSGVQMALQSDRLKIAERMPLATTLKNELTQFQIKLTKKGTDTYEAWRDGDHDDLVLAMAVALWYAETELPMEPAEARPKKPIEERPLGM